MLKGHKLIINKTNFKWYCISVLLTLRYLLPNYFDSIIEQNGLIETMVAVIPLMVGIYIIISSRCRITESFFPFILYYFLLVMATAVNRGYIGNVIIHSLHVLMLCLAVDIISKDESQLIGFLKAVRDITLVFYVANFIFTVIYPHGIPALTESPLFPTFLYGNVNSTIKYIIPGICCSCVLDNKNHKRISAVTLVFILGIFENAIRVYMTATAVVAALFILLWVLCKNWIVGKEKWIYLAILISLALFEFLIVLNKNSAEFVTLLTMAFKKTADFSGRRKLWDNTIRLIQEKWLWGYGYKTRDFLKQNIGNYSGSHNYFLDVIFQRGVFGEILFVSIITAPFILIKKRVLSDGEYILLGVCGACYLMFLIEPFFTTEYLIIPIIYLLVASLSKTTIVFKTKK